MFLLFILYLRYTNHMHKSWWKNEKMTNEISNENSEVTITPTPKNLSTCKRHHITARFIRRKDIYLRWAEQRACGHTEDPSSLLRLQTRWWMDGWMMGGWMGSWTNRAASRFSEFRDLKQKIRQWWITEGLWSPKQGWWSKRPLPSSSSKRLCVHARATAPSAGHAVSGKTSPSLCAVFAAPRPFLTFSFQHPVAFSFSSCLCTTRFQLFLCHAPVKFSYSLHVIFLVSHLGYFPLTFGFSIYVNLMFFQRSFSVTLNHPQDRSVTGSGYSKKDKSAFFLDSQQELCVLWGKFLGLNPKKKKTCRMFSGIIGLTKSWD